MKRLDQKTVDLHLDGEIKGEKARRVAQALEADPESLRLAEQTRRLGDAVRLSVEAELSGRPEVDLWESIEARIGREQKSRFSGRFRVFFQSRFPHVPWPVWAGAAAAVAAAVALWFGLAGRTPGTGPSPRPTNQIVFESIDYSGLPPTVFQIPDPDGQGSTTVIWVTADDADDDEEGTNEVPPPSGDSI